MQNLSVNQNADFQLVPGNVKHVKSDIMPTGRYIVEHWRNGQRINEYHFDNGVVNEGKNRLLNVMFNGGTQISSWYMGLIDNTGYSALADDDTYDDINQTGNGWDEFTNYTDAGNSDSATTRPAWDEAAASGQAITNANVTVFDITGSGVVKGLFLCGGVASANTKGDHDASGLLWATALFGSGDVTVSNGDQLKVTYTVST